MEINSIDDEKIHKKFWIKIEFVIFCLDKYVFTLWIEI